MHPESLYERVAALEPQLDDLKRDVEDLQDFKDSMIKEITELTASVKQLSWKISVATGAIMVVLDQLFQWGAKKLLPY